MMYYANEDSDDVINCSNKTEKVLNQRISLEILERCSSNLAPEMHITKKQNKKK